MKKIPLTQGYFAMVDDEDFDRVCKWKWCVSIPGKGNVAYAVHQENYKNILLHRFLMNAPRGFIVDHIDGNGLNCCQDNMRLCGVSENRWNSHKNRVRTSSRFKGVTWDSSRGLWMAHIKKGGKNITIGRFDTQEQAAHEYDKSAISMFGKYARLNFPMVGLPYSRQLFRLGLAWSY